MRRTLALFAKAPVPGRVKTRLVPPLSAEQAADLYEAMLRDILDLHATPAAGEGADLALWYSPRAAEAWFRRAAPPAYRLRPQAEGDLGARMRHLFQAHASEGCTRIVLRGTDSPTLPPGRVREAFEALGRVDLVLGPDDDGGYGLVGLREPCDALFDLPMSNPQVLDRTLERARRAGLRVEVLAPHYDVDTPGDLERLRADGSRQLAPRTFRWVEAWDAMQHARMEG